MISDVYCYSHNIKLHLLQSINHGFAMFSVESMCSGIWWCKAKSKQCVNHKYRKQHFRKNSL